jgi:hypothetical protein
MEGFEGDDWGCWRMKDGGAGNRERRKSACNAGSEDLKRGGG